MSQSSVSRNARSTFSPSASLAVGIPSIFSTIATFLILAHLVVSAGAQVYRRMRNGAKGERILLTTPLGLYIASLLFSTFLSAIGTTITIQWFKDGKILSGTTCSAQAMILQLGSLSTAFFVLYITCHALNAVVLRRPVAKWVMILCVAALWFFVLFLDLSAPLLVPKDPRAALYGPAGAWCWVGTQHPKSQKLLLAVPMLLVTGVSAILFAIIFVRASMNSTVNIVGGNSKAAVSKGLKEKSHMMAAKYLMWYPLVYVLFNFPLAVVALAGKATSTENGVVFAEVLYGFQGAAFAALFVITHRVIGGRPWRFGIGSYTLQAEQGKQTTESFAALEKAFSPTTPKAWKPAANEWSAPLDRNLSVRSNRYETQGVSTPAPPMPPMPTKLHIRNPSESTIVAQPEDELRDSATSLDTVVKFPEPKVDPMGVPPTQPISATRSADLYRQRSMPQQPLPSAMAKRGFQVTPKPLARKESSVRFATEHTIYNMSPVDSPAFPEMPKPSVPVELPSRPPTAATSASTTTSPTRKPVPKFDLPATPYPVGAPAPPPQGVLPQPPVAVQAAASAVSSSPVEPTPAPKIKPKQPMIIIPGRPERQTRDTFFVMETPVTLKNRPFTEIDMPVPIVNALTQGASSTSPIQEDRLQSPDRSSIASDGDAESILLYYEAEPSPPLHGVSPVPGNMGAGVPRIAVLPGTANSTMAGNQNPRPVRLSVSPGMLAPPPPGSRKKTSPKQGYV